MLHGPMTSHRTWDMMATFLHANGFCDLYAVDMPNVQVDDPTLAYIGRTLERIVQDYPVETPLALMGHSTGGVLARRYLYQNQLPNPILYVFTLASPHQQTYFSHKVFVPPEAEINYVQTPDIPRNTYIINVFGDKLGNNFDGSVRGVYLPEAVNLTFPIGHSELKRHRDVMAAILSFLKGQHFHIQLFLESLLMRGTDGDHRSGAFYFEVDGMRTPFDGVFQAVSDQYYFFDESSTPLSTLAFPITERSRNLVFRLKDRSRNRVVRRRLFGHIRVALSDQSDVRHLMQDSEGSEIVVRIRCQQMPSLMR
jgi:hypothetical protein